MSPYVIVLFSRYDSKNADFVDWIKRTLDGAGISCDLSEGLDTDAVKKARLVVAPLAGYGWRAITDKYAHAAVVSGVPVLTLSFGDLRGVSWNTLERCGALQDPLVLTDMSTQSASRLSAAAWAKIQTAQIELNVAMYASAGLEVELRQALMLLLEVPKAFGGRVSLRPLIWPERGTRADACVCLLWHDLRTALGGNEWAIDEWQTIENPSVLLFYRRRPIESDLDFDERLTRLRRETIEADEFIERTLALTDKILAIESSRSKAGNPPANFDRQLHEYLGSRVEFVVKRKALAARSEAQQESARSAVRPVISVGVPKRFRDPLEGVAFCIDPSAPPRIEPPPDGVSQAHFAAFAPESVEPGQSFLFEVWACRQRSYEDMLRRACRREGISVRGSKLTAAPPLGTVFEVSVDIPSFTTQETKDFLLWTGEPANASFVMTPSPDISSGWHVGTATISVGGVPLARLRFEVQVGRGIPDTRDISSNEQRVSSIFASYASVDRIEVLQWARGAQVAGVSVFLDVLSLRESSNWESELFNVVPASDLFCLFWSMPARQSVWVEREWRCALAARGVEYIHPVPLQDPREVPPPVELMSRHFGSPTFFLQQYEMLRRRHLPQEPPDSQQ